MCSVAVLFCFGRDHVVVHPIWDVFNLKMQILCLMPSQWRWERDFCKSFGNYCRACLASFIPAESRRGKVWAGWVSRRSSGLRGYSLLVWQWPCWLIPFHICAYKSPFLILAATYTELWDATIKTALCLGTERQMSVNTSLGRHMLLETGYNQL